MALMKGEGRFEIIYKPWTVVGRADEFDGWMTMPDALGRTAGVVVASDVYGVTPALKELAKVLSRMGFAAVVPDLFYRAGSVPPGATRAQADAIAGRFSDGRLLADLEDTASFLASTGAFDPDRLGVVGIGFGGRLAILLAARHPDLFQSVIVIDPLLGKVPLADGTVRPRVALDEAEDVRVPLLAIFAGKSDAVSPEEIDRFREVTAQVGSVVVYPDAEAGFWDEDAQTHSPGATTDALGRVIGVLDAALGYQPT
jgi:carboxymethylenebutenolidase